MSYSVCSGHLTLPLLDFVSCSLLHLELFLFLPKRKSEVLSKRDKTLSGVDETTLIALTRCRRRRVRASLAAFGDVMMSVRSQVPSRVLLTSRPVAQFHTTAPICQICKGSFYRVGLGWVMRTRGDGDSRCWRRPSRPSTFEITTLLRSPLWIGIDSSCRHSAPAGREREECHAECGAFLPMCLLRAAWRGGVVATNCFRKEERADER